MRNVLLLSLIQLSSALSIAQNYDSYYTGNTSDVTTSPEGGICLMGGATEEDEAMKWFLNRANGGDILVLRTSGSDGYNDYFYSQLGVTVNSVETIVFNDASASNEAYIQQKISQAEAIWFAGGDQWDYHSYWYNTPISTAINQTIANGSVVGGTSAGMAILGGFRFTAENGTVTSATALNNPYDANVTLHWGPFIVTQSVLNYTITDTHYDNPDRKGRHMVFMARSLDFTNMDVKGIACDEYTAVCIDENGLARVFGQYPTYDDNAYFLQINCELSNPYPEVLNSLPLTWDHNGIAVKAYAVKGTLAGTNTFDLNDWQTGSGGEWQDWSVVNGVFNEAPGAAPNCGNVSTNNNGAPIELLIAPNPTSDEIRIQTSLNETYSVEITASEGTLIRSFEACSGEVTLAIKNLAAGVYTVRVLFEDGRTSIKQITIVH